MLARYLSGGDDRPVCCAFRGKLVYLSALCVVIACLSAGVVCVFGCGRCFPQPLFRIEGMTVSIIKVSDLTFCYEGSYDNIFENVSFQLDADWRLGLTGRNGRGKTTLLRLLEGIFHP